MKNLNLIKRLWTDSHEKQKVRGMQKYCILLLLLFTCVTHAYATDMYVPGLFGDWGTPKNIKLVDRGSNVYSAYFQLNAQKYTFKINNGSWGDQNDYNRGKNDSGHPSVGTAYSMKKNGGNMEVTISTAGLYLFSVNTSTWKLTITQVKPTEAAPSNVVSGTNVMFYIQGYTDNGADYLTNGSAAAATSYPMNFDPSYSYVNTAKTNLSTYNHVSDNPTVWSGVTNSNISNATGGELFVANGSTSKTAAKTLTTHSTSMSGDVLTITTKTSGTTGSCCSMPLYIQYYIDGTFAGVTYSAATASYASIKATGSNQTATYNCSSLTNGTHVLKTVLTDGLVYYVAASDNFTVAHTYSITYKDEGDVTYTGDNGGSLPSSYTYGTGIATLTAGEKAGYDFGGWYTNSTCTEGPVISISSSATGAKTFYAKWTASSTRTLTYHANWYTTGTSGDVPAAQVVAKDGTAIVAGRNTLAMTNYTFSGWNTEEYITGTSYAEGSSITMDEDKDLYAVWTRSITLNQNGATTNGTTSVTGTYNCSTLPSITNPQKTGYTFVGWRTENNGTGNLVINTSGELQPKVYHWTDETTPSNRFQRNPSSTTPLYATWTQSVSLNANTGNHGSGTDKTGTATWNGASITIPTHCSAATGYSLDGYYTDATEGTKILNADGTYAGLNITVSGDPYISSGKWVHPGATTLYAQYTPNNYTITFSPNGGSVDPTSRSVTYDAAITNAPVPTKTGYNFTGYNTAGGVSITTNTGVFKASVDGFTDASAHWIKASNATITAQWTAKTTTVTLDPQSGSGGTESVTATYGSAMPSATMPTRLGYTFGGYYTNTGGAGTQYYTSGGASARTWNFEDATKTLYAKWTATTYTITYNLNDGANPGGAATSFTIESALITLPTPSRTGYTFGGWYGNSSFTGSAITTIAAGSTGNKEYWAKWTPKNYSITYDPVSAPEGVTYTTTPSNANCDATVDMVFTPTGDNTVIVSVVDGSSNPVAVTNPSANTYRFTMPASNVTVHVSVQSLPMVYVLKTKDASAYIPFGSTSAFTSSASQVKIWAWKVEDDTNFYTGSYPGQSASDKASEYTDAHGNVWWRFVPENDGFTRSTPFKLILVYDNSGQTKIYESDGTHHISDGVTRTSYNGSTNASFTGTVWVVPGGTSANTATLYYENPSTQHKYVFVEGRFKAYTDKSRTTPIYTGSNEGDWNETSRNIRMLYDETNSRYYLHTYCTPNELKSIKSNPGYINLHTSSVVTGFSSDTRYYLNTSGQNLTEAGQKRDFTSTTSGHRPYITSTVTNKYVVLYWDESKLWYEEEPIPAQISSISLSASRVPPMAEITATPNMSVMGTVDQAYCWAVYSDEECTSPVNVSFTSLGSGRVQFTVPQTIGTYYLKLTVRASAACNASIDDEEVQSFNVTTDNMVFFNKTDIPWSGVFVYFLGDGSYWDDNLGSGCASKDYGRANQMHRIGKSDIYYYEYSGNALGNNDIQYIAFTEYGKPNSEHFAYTNAAYREDFKRSCAPMYVPENWITDRLNNCEYYNRGYWTTYGVSGVARNAGFTLKVFDGFDGGTQLASVDLSNTDGSNTYRATVNLTKVNYSYAYQLLSCGNKYYGNDGVMNANNSTNWKFEPDKHRCGLNSQASGNYDFIVQCTDGGEVRVSVEFPLMNGDYRLIYNDTCVYQTGWHPSQFIRHNYSDGAKLDTVSMYIRPNKQPTLKIQVCDNASSTPPTWRDSITYDVSGLTYGHGVYNFYISQEDGKLTINDVRPYTGLYYIRTQQADGGWTGYKTNSDNVMTYTEYAEQKNYGFNYYMTKWIGTTGADVTFTIACDYSESLCDTMVADPGNNPLDASQARSIPHSASVRFGWNSLTNTLHRAYINGTSIVSDRYLVMIGDAKMKDKDGKALTTEGGGKVSGLNDYEMNFTDLNNWIYRCDVKAVTGAKVQLVGNYDGHTQHFIGTAEKPEEIIGGGSGEEYLMRVTYDFKTNRLMTAWLPDGDAITSDMTLNADMMLIREGQNAATQVYFGEGAKTIDEIHSIYGVMEFQYSKFANQFPNWSAPHAYEYLMYYISFPFDVKVSEIFGCGVRGKNWIIQKYNGAKRAKIGWFAETSTFWETLPGDSTLHAHEGYLLLLDRISFNDPGSNVWTNRPEKVYLYFPSISNTIGTISDKDKSIEVPSHVCDINRSFTVDGVGTVNHKNTDSHWNVIGTPLFENKKASTIAEPEEDGDGNKTLQYYYAWDCADNTLSARSSLTTSTEFKSMHGYMVQYSGTVTFHGASIEAVPASVAARHMSSDEKNYRIELQLINENGKTNRTYVELRENACDTFALNEDMYMMRSSRTVDLYSFAGAYDVAANVLSVNNHIVPVGTDVKVAGTYRFTMPSDFSGTVTLIDTETGTRTNLAFGDYEVNLPKGTSNNRFLLEININKMPTSIDGVDGGSLKDGKAHKFIQNGQMYILQNGIIYDAQGKRVK